MKKTLTKINNQLAAIDAQDIKNAKNLLKKVSKLQEQKKIATIEARKNEPKVPSAVAQVKEIISHYADHITPQRMTLFMNSAFSKEFFNTRYPFFVEVTDNMTDEEKKKLRNDDNNRARYGIVEYQFVQLGDRKFYLTNDIYHKNLNLIKNAFKFIFE